MTRLYITARCITDLADLGDREAETIVAKYIELRGSAPEAGEAISGLRQRPCTSLHAGRYRGVTWHDTAHDVVWLLAAGLHRAANRDDSYALAIQLETADRLYPTAADYARLALEEQQAYLKQEARDLAQLCAQVLQAPDAGVQTYTSAHDLYVEIVAELLEELALVAIRIRMRRHANQWLKEAELAILLAGPFAHPPLEVPDQESPLFRQFEGYIPLQQDNAG